MPVGLTPPVRIGTAGWAIPADYRTEFAAGASVLHRYSSRLNAVEINSSFYRPHQRKTYERWADSVGLDFRFAVKTPKSITHLARLSNCHEQVSQFTNEIGGLGIKLGVVLVQLPPSLGFDKDVAEDFFRMLGKHVSAPIACEPRHRSWFSKEAGESLERFGIARVEADPAIAPQPPEPSAFGGIAYLRLHGTPKIYDSEYSPTTLSTYATRIAACAEAAAAVWCMFDNTMHGHATANAIRMTELISRL